jgi:hypothetical protein
MALDPESLLYMYIGDEGDSEVVKNPLEPYEWSVLKTAMENNGSMNLEKLSEEELNNLIEQHA